MSNEIEYFLDEKSYYTESLCPPLKRDPPKNFQNRDRGERRRVPHEEDRNVISHLEWVERLRELELETEAEHRIRRYAIDLMREEQRFERQLEAPRQIGYLPVFP